MIADLPYRQPQVMTWRWDGFSDEEIAGELGDSAMAVRKNRSRVMKNLGQLLADVGRDPVWPGPAALLASLTTGERYREQDRADIGGVLGECA